MQLVLDAEAVNARRTGATGHGDLPPGWVLTSIGEVCAVVSGATPKTGVTEYWGGDIPWVTPDDMSRNPAKIMNGGRRFLTRAGYESCSTRLLPAGSVLFSSRAPIGYVAIAGREICTNQGFKTAVPPAGVDSSYLYWYLQHKTPEIESRASGTTFTEISGKGFAQTEMPLPPLREQHRIVTALEDYLSRLDAATAILGRCEPRMAALFLRVLNDRVGRVPGRVPLASVLRQPLANGRSVPTKAGGFPVLRLTALRNGSLDLAERKAGHWTEVDAMPFLVAKDDFFVARGNGSLNRVGRGGLLETEPDLIAFPDTMIRIRVDKKRILPRFLRLIWDSDLVRHQIEGSARTTAGIYKISQSTLENVVLPITAPGEQERIALELEDMFASGESCAAVVASARLRSGQLRRGMLAKAFAGRLVPRDPGDEPASVLLERIRRERGLPVTAHRPPALRRAVIKLPLG